MHISFKITGGCQCGEPMWYSRSFTSPPAASMVTRRSLVFGDKECLSERSEESGEEGQDNGPRTRHFCIYLNDRTLQKSVVRGPLKKVGTANKAISQHIDLLQDTKPACSRSVWNRFFTSFRMTIRNCSEGQ